MGKNNYIQRRRNEQQVFLDIGERMGIQKACDYIQIALRDPEVMGKGTFGRARIEKLFRRVAELADYFHTAFTFDVEADNRQEEMDAALREIYGDDLETFYERYPELKKIRYDKARKGWV